MVDYNRLGRAGTDINSARKLVFHSHGFTAEIAEDSVFSAILSIEVNRHRIGDSEAMIGMRFLTADTNFISRA
jgi:hypothetical protein